ncbi:MAG: phenylalanine--tRNA ligase beta subunit-related protein [Anaerolineae bacterium]|jgi:DNA/RNA-binding domain of Phe-tRNA-synthetase-like protein
MDKLILSEALQTEYPEAAVGVLVMRHVANPDHHPALESRKAELEEELRSRYGDYDRARLRQLPTIQAYDAYYKRFRKTYHVLLQLESVALKHQPIFSVAALVEAMLMAELKSLMLTAGHDLDVVQEPVRVDVAQGTERYTQLNGKQQVLKAGDMFIADAAGVISSIIYGPDRRTRIRSTTQQVLFTTYAPPGIRRETVDQHLRDIRANVLLVAPGAQTVLLRVDEAT